MVKTRSSKPATWQTRSKSNAVQAGTVSLVDTRKKRVKKQKQRVEEDIEEDVIEEPKIWNKSTKVR